MFVVKIIKSTECQIIFIYDKNIIFDCTSDFYNYVLKMLIRIITHNTYKMLNTLKPHVSLPLSLIISKFTTYNINKDFAN